MLVRRQRGERLHAAARPRRRRVRPPRDLPGRRRARRRPGVHDARPGARAGASGRGAVGDPGADLARAHLAGADLAGADFAGADGVRHPAGAVPAAGDRGRAARCRRCGAGAARRRWNGAGGPSPHGLIA
ncbi:pentapeptide repeat-containing protein [Serinibacter arcticus]|uniref:pentapeptide repeat-containing protein n=1 Tax=Serinibacter arcticus TaxID=1655435 RepID=UPI003AF32457